MRAAFSCFLGVHMQVDTQVVLGVAGLTFGAIVWAVRIEGRVNLQEREMAHITKTLDEIRHDVKEIGAFFSGGTKR